MFLFTLTSCKYNQAKFIITNNSDFTIDSLNIYPDSKNQYLFLEQRDEKVLYTGMDEINIDGVFLIKFKRNNKLVEKELSYFSNGKQIEKNLKINILNDSIIFNSNFLLNYQ